MGESHPDPLEIHPQRRAWRPAREYCVHSGGTARGPRGNRRVHPEAIERIRANAGHLLISSSDELRIVSQEHRSQAQNREACVARLKKLIEACEAPPKIRRKTKPTRGSKERRLKAKKEHSEKKRNRGWKGEQ